MVRGWELQQRSRGLRSETIRQRVQSIRRFQEWSGEYPWTWRPQDVEEYTAHRASRKNLRRTTLRHDHETIRMFCGYLIDPHYEWVSRCIAEFGSAPTQICYSWNTTRHLSEFESGGERRPFSVPELQRLFDCADERVSALIRDQRKGALGALRDAQLLKTTYAFGLRRREVVGLDLVDLHPNHLMPSWGPYGSVSVRWGKASAGGGPKRRTVLLIPEFDWIISGMRQWVEEARPRFAPGDLSALWVTERKTRISAHYLDRRFATIRDQAGLPEELTLHSLRHSFVTHCIEFGYAERFVQEQVGHAYASTTAIYTSVSNDFKNRVFQSAMARVLPATPDGEGS
ncbi:tyrosine-type recombinase/integrase [Microbacterium sp. bgisy203]|uniref:tyrosine-type recombinase/integrase n=1 Tax=Microbacterium sp. bgisy203 TaxID=3413799 RepID=UPI003D75D807